MESKVIINNNFNILRLFFATFVVFTHSFFLSGHTSAEPFGRLTNGQINFSYIGLRGFFIISGFLIFQSFKRSSSIFDFLWKRFLRIYPGLLAVSIFAIFIVGPIISSLTFKDYFTSNATFQVFIESIDLFFHKNLSHLPGVFEMNIYSPEINGSLWTISYEFLLYIGFIFLFFTKNKKILPLFLVTVIAAFLFYKLNNIDVWYKYEYYIFNSEIGVIAFNDFGLFFLIGALFASLNYQQFSQKFHVVIFIVSLLVISFLLYFNLFKKLYLLLLIPCILSLGLLKESVYDITKKIGDISYGIYLSGFFIQQFYLSIYKFEPYLLMLLSVCTSILYGLFSWNYIEKPALQFKNKFRKL